MFPYDRWSQQLPKLAEEFQKNRPFPHIHLKEAIRAEDALAVAREFPNESAVQWKPYNHVNEKKSGQMDRKVFPQAIGKLVDEFNSDAFVKFLSELTGISGLMADPMLEGGGMHQTVSGGFLNIHSDFTMHHYEKKWWRRLNLILYLNENWEDSWGGAIEFWNEDVTRCEVKVSPVINNMVIFETTEKSFHGYPVPLTCPKGVTRNSIALYYYTLDKLGQKVARSTHYRPVPTDSFWKRVKMRADNWLLDLYSSIKTRLGLSDDFAFRIIRFFSRPTPQN